MTYNRISADCHLDLIWLPPDLFVSEAPAGLKDRMPYVADGPEGPRWVAGNGATFGLACEVGASGKHLPPDVTHKITCENAGRFYGLIPAATTAAPAGARA